MADLRLNIIVDDNGAVQKLGEVEAAEKRVQAAASGMGGTIAGQSRTVTSALADQEKSAVRAASAFEGLGTKFKNFAALAGSVFAGNAAFAIIGGLQGMAEHAFAAAGRLSDLSDKTGLSAETLQRLDFAGKQAGVTLEQFGTAAFQLQVNLGKTGAAGRRIADDLTAMGLSVRDVLAMSPDQQFMTIATALSHVSDVQERNRLGFELYGKSFKQIAPAITEEFDRMTKAAVVASNEQVKALDDLSDAWDRFVTNAESRSTQFLGSLVTVAQGAQQVGFWRSMFEIGSDMFSNGQGGIGAGFGALAAAQAGKPHDINLPASGAPGGIKDTLSGVTLAKSPGLTAAQLAEQRAIDELTGAATIRAFDDFTRRLAIAGGLTTQTDDKVKAYAKTIFDVIEKHGALGDSAEKNWDRVYKSAVNALGQLEDRLGISLDRVLPFIGAQTDPILAETAALHGVNMTPSFGLPLDPFSGMIGQPIGNEQQPGAFDPFGGFTPGTALGMEAPPDAQGLSFGALLTSPALLSLAGHFGSSQGSRSAEQYLSTAEQLLGKGGLNLFGASGGSMAAGGAMASVGLGLMMNSQGKVANAASGALTGAGIGTMIMPGIGTAIGAGVGALAGYIKGVLSQAGRNVVKQFADSFGGFDALHAQLNQLGDEGEQLWIKLTQGVGHANPNQAKQVVGEIQQAFKDLQDRIDKVKKTVQDLSSPGTLASLDQLKSIANSGDTPDEHAALQQFYQQQTGNSVSGLTQFLSNTSISSQETASGAVGATLATFQMLENQGLSMSAIVQQLGPVVQQLTQQLLAAGLQGGDTFGTLIHYTDLFSNVSVQHASDALQGLVITETALANVGQLTNETFAGLDHAIVDTAAALQNQGLSGADIQLVLHPAIQRAWELEQDFHVQADAATQALIDQAVAAGTVGEAFRDPMTQLTDAIKDMTQEFRNFLGLISTGLPAAAQTGVAGANSAFGGFHPPDAGNAGSGEVPEQGDNGGAVVAHSGGMIWRRMHSGGLASDEVPIIGQTGEFMISRRGVAAIGVQALRRINAGQVEASVGVTYANTYLDGQLIATAVVPHLPGAVRNVVPRYS